MPVKRNRAMVSITLPRDVLEMLEELSRLSGWSRSRCIEECVRASYPEMARRFKILKRDAESVAEELYWENEYWKKIIFDVEDSRRWTRVA